jgi:hypothetical protein
VDAVGDRVHGRVGHLLAQDLAVAHRDAVDEARRMLGQRGHVEPVAGKAAQPVQQFDPSRTQHFERERRG